MPAASVGRAHERHRLFAERGHHLVERGLRGARRRAGAHHRGESRDEGHALARREPHLARALSVGDDRDAGIEGVVVEVDEVVGETAGPANDPQLLDVLGDLLRCSTPKCSASSAKGVAPLSSR